MSRAGSSCNEFVVGQVTPVEPPQTALPLREKVIGFPLTPELPAVSVAERFAVPP